MIVESDDLYSGFQKVCLNYTIGKTTDNNQTKMTEVISIIEFLLTPTSEGELIVKLCDKKETIGSLLHAIQIRNWFLQAAQAVKIQFELDYKSSS